MADAGYKGVGEPVEVDGQWKVRVDMAFTKCYLFLEWDGESFYVSHATGNGAPVTPENGEDLPNPAPTAALDLVNDSEAAKGRRIC